MKHFFNILLLIIVCFTLMACKQRKHEEAKGEVSKEETDKVNNESEIPPKKSIITTHKFERQLLTKDKKITLLRGEFMYPQIENVESYASVDQMNQEIKEDTEKQFEKSFTEGADYVKEFYINGETTSLNLPFVTEQKFEVKNNENYIVSFLITSYYDFGGAHPNILQSAYTYDVRTGERLKASHFIGETEEGVKELVAQTFYTVVLEQPEEFYPNAGEILSKGQFQFDFYVQSDSITFFINPYVIAPYAGGVQEVSILLR